MIADLAFLGRLLDRFFEQQMRRAAVKIRARSQFFEH
jgi:hypothetical protein